MIDFVETEEGKPKHEWTHALKQTGERTCVRTANGRWVRKMEGLSPQAECHWWHPRIAESDSEAPSESEGPTTPGTPSEAVTGDSVDSQGMSRGDALATGERMTEYGHPKVSFDRIAALWSAYLTAPEVDAANLTGEDVGKLMVLLKVSRSITDRKADTLDDIEGYVSCIRMLRDF